MVAALGGELARAEAQRRRGQSANLLRMCVARARNPGIESQRNRPLGNGWHAQGMGGSLPVDPTRSAGQAR